MPRDSCTLPQSLTESYAGKAYTLPPKPFRMLCREIPLRLHINLKVMPKNPCTLSHIPFRELYQQSLYGLTKILFESYAGKACTLSLQIPLEVMPGDTCMLPNKVTRKLCPTTCTFLLNPF